MREFWDSEANKFTLYGAIFGFLFPVIATILEAVQLGGLTVENMIEVQRSDPLLWIIDSAPFWLGLFARFAGWRQDQLKKIIRRNAPVSEDLQENFEDSRQFAGVLTFLAGGLISVVLFLVIFWLQSLITTTLTQLPAATPNAGNVAVVEPAVGVNSQPGTPPAQPTPVPPTFTPSPVVIVVEQGASGEPVPATAVVTSEVSGELLDATQIVPDIVLEQTQETAASPVLQATAIEPTAAEPTQGIVIRIGVMDRAEIDCLSPSELTVVIWQEVLGIDVIVEEFTTTDELFQALVESENPRHIDVTLCYVDPVDRGYLRQYAGALQVMGNAFVRAGEVQLLTLESGAPIALREDVVMCVDNQLRNHEYDLAEISDIDPAAWVAVHQELIQTWMDCSLLS